MVRYGKRNFIGMKLPVLARRNSRSSVSWTNDMASRRTKTEGFVVCLQNAGYEASLEIRKLYPVVGDPDAENSDLIRVIDESGDDYVYPSEFFGGSRYRLKFNEHCAWRRNSGRERLQKLESHPD